MEYQYGDWSKATGGRPRSPHWRNVGNKPGYGVVDATGGAIMQTVNQSVQWKEMQAVAEQVCEAKVPCASDSPDKGEAEIPGTTPDFQQEDVDKGLHA